MSRKVKIAYLIFFGAIAGSVIHNLIYAIFSFEEPVFFLVSVLSVPTLLVYLFVNSVIFLKTKKPKDWWKVVWMVAIVTAFVLWAYLQQIRLKNQQQERGSQPRRQITKIT